MKSQGIILAFLILVLSIGGILYKSPSLRAQLLSELQKIWERHKENLGVQNPSPYPTITGIVKPTHTPSLDPKFPGKFSKVSLPNRIREIATKTTVFISVGDKVIGSGVIIGKKGKTLYLLTASHVVGIPPGTAEDPYKIVTNEGEEFQVTHFNYDEVVNKLPKTDLAVLLLESTSQEDDKKTVAQLEKSVSPGMPIYLFGYLPCLQSSKGDKGKQNHLSKRKIYKIEPRPKFDKDSMLGGYDIFYNNNTIEGMSGSPVFDENGRVIAIHAKTEQKKERYDPEDCNTLPSNPASEFGENWGISIKSFFEVKSNLPPGLESILRIAPSPPEEGKPIEPSPSPNPTETELHRVNCSLIRGIDEVCPEERKDVYRSP